MFVCLFGHVNRGDPEANAGPRGHAKTSGGGARFADVEAPGWAGGRATVPPNGQQMESHNIYSTSTLLCFILSFVYRLPKKNKHEKNKGNDVCVCVCVDSNACACVQELEETERRLTEQGCVRPLSGDGYAWNHRSVSDSCPVVSPSCHSLAHTPSERSPGHSRGTTSQCSLIISSDRRVLAQRKVLE